nr:MAG TPA: hypothetical protein [Caudoviricetes sp.]
MGVSCLSPCVPAGPLKMDIKKMLYFYEQRYSPDRNNWFTEI